MNRLGKLLSYAAAGISLSLGTNAKAALYWDLELFSSSQSHVSVGDALQGTFDITGNGLGKGFVGNGPEQVQSAFFEFTLVDDSDRNQVKTESWSISLGDQGFSTGGGSLILALVCGFGNGSVLLDIQQDGQVDFTVAATSGDFRVVNGLMKVETGPRTSSRVPEGGLSILMLGGALLTAAALHRKR